MRHTPLLFERKRADCPGTILTRHWYWCSSTGVDSKQTWSSQFSSEASVWWQWELLAARTAPTCSGHVVGFGLVECVEWSQATAAKLVWARPITPCPLHKDRASTCRAASDLPFLSTVRALSAAGWPRPGLISYFSCNVCIAVSAWQGLNHNCTPAWLACKLCGLAGQGWIS